MGLPGDPDGQRAVLLATLKVLEMAQEPDTFIELLFEWSETAAQARRGEAELEPPPIAALLRKKPWLLSRLYSGVIPHDEQET
jgi:hypothetical protein